MFGSSRVTLSLQEEPADYCHGIDSDHQVITRTPCVFHVLNERIGHRRPKAREWHRPHIQESQANESMFKRYELAYYEGVRQLRGSRKSDEDRSADQHRNARRDSADDASQQSQRRAQNEEPSPPKQVGESPDQNLSDCECECVDQRYPDIVWIRTDIVVDHTK
jgi:hypothetical protein